MISWWAHWRDKDTYTQTSLTSRTPTHTQHKEISPFSVMQSLRPWPPFQCYLGVVEKKFIPLSLSVWFPNAPSLSSTSGPHSPLQCSPRTKPLRVCNKPSIRDLTGEKQFLGSFLALSCPKWYHISQNTRGPNQWLWETTVSKQQEKTTAMTHDEATECRTVQTHQQRWKTMVE